MFTDVHVHKEYHKVCMLQTQAARWPGFLLAGQLPTVIDADNARGMTGVACLHRWAVMNFAPGGDTYFTCVVNSGVHVAMCVRSYLALKSSVEAPCHVTLGYVHIT